MKVIIIIENILRSTDLNLVVHVIYSLIEISNYLLDVKIFW